MALNLKQSGKGGGSLVADNATDKGRRVLEHFPGNSAPNQIVNTVARTDTAAKTLGTLPQNAIITRIMWTGVANSDAGTTGTMSVGYGSGTGTELINAVSVKASSTSQNLPAAGAVLAAGVVSASADTVITGIYAETGGASTTGGPWQVVIDYYCTT